MALKVIIGKFILNILYYKFIEKSRKKFFFTFCDTKNPKMQKKSIGPSVKSFFEFYSIFYIRPFFIMFTGV